MGCCEIPSNGNHSQAEAQLLIPHPCSWEAIESMKAVARRCQRTGAVAKKLGSLNRT